MARRTVSYKAPSGWSKRIDIDYGETEAPKGWDRDGDGRADGVWRPTGIGNNVTENRWAEPTTMTPLAGISPVGNNPMLPQAGGGVAGWNDVGVRGATTARTQGVKTNAGGSRPVAGANPYGVGTWFPNAQGMTVSDRRMGSDDLTTPALQGGVPLTENLEAQRQAANANQAAASGPKFAAPPSWAANLQGFDLQWWNAFQTASHRLGTEDVKGVTPIEFYLPAANGNEKTALQLAITDKLWGEQFYRTYGRPPTDDDWRFHWYAQRGGVPGQEPAQQTTMTDYQKWAQFPSGQGQPYASPGPIYR